MVTGVDDRDKHDRSARFGKPSAGATAFEVVRAAWALLVVLAIATTIGRTLRRRTSTALPSPQQRCAASMASRWLAEAAR